MSNAPWEGATEKYGAALCLGLKPSTDQAKPAAPVLLFDLLHARRCSNLKIKNLHLPACNGTKTGMHQPDDDLDKTTTLRISLDHSNSNVYGRVPCSMETLALSIFKLRNTLNLSSHNPSQTFWPSTCPVQAHFPPPFCIQTI